MSVTTMSSNAPFQRESCDQGNDRIGLQMEVRRANRSPGHEYQEKKSAIYIFIILISTSYYLILI